jgi:hypothetical protein
MIALWVKNRSASFKSFNMISGLRGGFDFKLLLNF